MCFDAGQRQSTFRAYYAHTTRLLHKALIPAQFFVSNGRQNSWVRAQIISKRLLCQKSLVLLSVRHTTGNYQHRTLYGVAGNSSNKDILYELKEY